MKLSKKVEKLIKRRALEYKKILEDPNPEIDSIVAELKASVSDTPKGMTLKEEMDWIMSKAEENYMTIISKLRKENSELQEMENEAYKEWFKDFSQRQKTQDEVLDKIYDITHTDK